MRKRSRYRPRELKNTLTLMQPVMPGAQTDVLLRKWQAINALSAGAGSREAWDSLAEVVNTVEMAAAMGYLDASCRTAADSAQTALHDVAHRAMAGLSWWVSASEEWHISRALDIYHHAVELLPAAELLGAHKAAAERTAQMRGGL